MVFCNELGSQSLNIYHKLRLQSRGTKYSFLKFGSSFFRRWHWYSKYRNNHFWTRLTSHLSLLNSTEPKIFPLKSFEVLMTQNCHQYKSVTNRVGTDMNSCTSQRQKHTRPRTIRDSRTKIGRLRENLKYPGPTRSTTENFYMVSDRQGPPSNLKLPLIGIVHGSLFDHTRNKYLKTVLVHEKRTKYLYEKCTKKWSRKVIFNIYIIINSKKWAILRHLSYMKRKYNPF